MVFFLTNLIGAELTEAVVIFGNIFVNYGLFLSLFERAS
jgi:hypothetical protein